MAINQKRALIGVGMHRSGLTVLSDCLNILGMRYDKTMMSANELNDSFLLLNQEISYLNNLVYRDLGCRWDMIGSLPPGWINRKEIHHVREKIADFIREVWEKEDIVAIADPRFSFLMPIWLEELKNNDINSSFVFMIRQPFEVAKLLQQEFGFDMLKGHLLWTNYTKAAANVVKNHEYIVLEYESLKDNPRKNLKKILKDLCVGIFENLKRSEKNIIEHLGLYHKRNNWHEKVSFDEPEYQSLRKYSDFYSQICDSLLGAGDKVTDKKNVSNAIHGLNYSNLEVKTEKHKLSENHDLFNQFGMQEDLIKVIRKHEQRKVDRDVQLKKKLAAADDQAEPLYAHIYFPVFNGDKEYTKKRSKKILLATNEWQNISVYIPAPIDIGRKKIRIDPLNSTGMVQISNIKVVDEVTNKVHWSIPDKDGFSACVIEGNCIVLGTDKGIHICATGDGPSIMLPKINGLPDLPLKIEVMMKVKKDISGLSLEWDQRKKENKIEMDMLRQEVFKHSRDSHKYLEDMIELEERYRSENTMLNRNLSEYKTFVYKRKKELEQRCKDERKQSEKIKQFMFDRRCSEKKYTDLHSLVMRLGALLKIEDQKTGNNKLSIGRGRVFSKNAPLEDIENVFKEVNALPHPVSGGNAKRIVGNYYNESTVSNTFLDKLHMDLLNIVMSRRWSVGNKIISLLSLGMLSIKRKTALDSLRERLDEINNLSFDEKCNTQLIKNKYHYIEKDFQALTSSFRWRIFHFDIYLFHNMVFALDRIDAMLDFYNSMPKNPSKISPSGSLEISMLELFNNDNVLPILWYFQVREDVKNVINSKRWNLFNKIVSILTFGVCKIKKQTALDGLRNRLNNSKLSLTYKKNYTLLFKEQCRSIEAEFYALIRSIRWRISHLDINILKNILSKNSIRSTMDRISISMLLLKELDSHFNKRIKTKNLVENVKAEPVAYLNVLFVYNKDLNDNDGYSIKLNAKRLMDLGANCKIAVSKDYQKNDKIDSIGKFIQTYKQIEEKGVIFKDNRGPDIIHAWSPVELTREFCEKLRLQYQCPLVVHIERDEEYVTETAIGRPFNELENLQEKELDKIVSKNIYHPIKGKKFLSLSKGVTISNESNEILLNNNKQKLVLTPMVDETLFYPRPMNIELRNELGISKDQIVIVLNENVDSTKVRGVRGLYEALHLLNKEGISAVLIRTGENMVPLGSEDWIKAHEINIGKVSNCRISEFLAAADVFVQTDYSYYLSEYFIPNSLLEYFAMGKPIVLPNKNIGKIIEHGKEGYRLDNVNGESIANAVKRIHMDTDLAKKLSVGSLSFYQTKIARNFSKQLYDFYFNCVTDN